MFALEPEPIFYFSVNFRIGVGIFMIVDSVGLGLFTLSIGPPPPGFVLIVLGVFGGLLVTFQSLSLQVRKAEFYESSFRVKGRNLKKEYYLYSEVKDVVLVEALWPNTTVTILLKGDKEEEESLTITKNPTSRELDTDLYSWLKEKIGSPTEDDTLDSEFQEGRKFTPQSFGDDAHLTQTL